LSISKNVILKKDEIFEINYEKLDNEMEIHSVIIAMKT
jgi:hypothetical protein